MDWLVLFFGQISQFRQCCHLLHFCSGWFRLLLLLLQMERELCLTFTDRLLSCCFCRTKRWIMGGTHQPWFIAGFLPQLKGFLGLRNSFSHDTKTYLKKQTPVGRVGGGKLTYLMTWGKNVPVQFKRKREGTHPMFWVLCGENGVFSGEKCLNLWFSTHRENDDCGTCLWTLAVVILNERAVMDEELEEKECFSKTLTCLSELLNFACHRVFESVNWSSLCL